MKRMMILAVMAATLATATMASAQRRDKEPAQAATPKGGGPRKTEHKDEKAPNTPKDKPKMPAAPKKAGNVPNEVKPEVKKQAEQTKK